MWDFRHPAKKSPGLQEEAKLRSEIKWPLGLSPSLPPSSVARQKSEFQGNAFSCFHRFLIQRYEKLETEDPERRRQEAAVEELVRINHKIVRIQLLFSTDLVFLVSYSRHIPYHHSDHFDDMMFQDKLVSSITKEDFEPPTSAEDEVITFIFTLLLLLTILSGSENGRYECISPA